MKYKILSTALSLTLMFSVSSNVFAKDTSTVEPSIMGQAAVSIDASTGEVIYSKNPDEKIYPASTTKLLTAILLTENKKPSDLLDYSESAKEQPEYSFNKNMHELNVGQKITADNVLKGLLMYSANDMAYVIAANLTNQVKASSNDVTNSFSALMNKKVQALGLKNTHFVTANGLHDPNHYSTAYDMSEIAKTAYSNQWILNTIETQKATVTTQDGIQFPIVNRNKLIDPTQPVYDKTCLGGKTGYTTEAGKCLVALYNRNGHKIIGVVMKSVYDSNDLQVFKDMASLMDYSYRQTPTELYKGNYTYNTIKLSYKPFRFFGPTKSIDVPIVLKDSVDYYKNQLNDSEKSLSENVSNINPWKLNSNNSVGTLTLKERGVVKNYKLYPALSSKDLMKKNLLLYLLSSVGILVAIGIIIFGVTKITKKFRRKKSYF